MCVCVREREFALSESSGSRVVGGRITESDVDHLHLPEARQRLLWNAKPSLFLFFPRLGQDMLEGTEAQTHTRCYII